LSKQLLLLLLLLLLAHLQLHDQRLELHRAPRLTSYK
jgi:hypothetical protein